MPSVSSASALLSIATERLTRETERADAAERKCMQLASQLRSSYEQRTSLQLHLDKTQRELELYRRQLDLAHKEIKKAEEIVAQVDRARVQAEEQAARERSKVRQLMERAAIKDALEQGRETGFREGLERGKTLTLSQMLARHDGPDNHEAGRRNRSSSHNSSSTSSAPARRAATSPQPPRTTEASTRVQPPRQHSAANRNARSSSPLLPVRPPSSTIRQPRPVPAPRAAEERDVQPIPHRAATPSRPLYQIPPDGYIPIIEPGSPILLPPPHELSRPIFPSRSPGPERGMGTPVRPSSALSSGSHVRVPAVRPSVPVEENRIAHHEMERPTSAASTASRSTTISHFEFLRKPRKSSSPPLQMDGIAQQWDAAVSDLRDISARNSNPNNNQPSQIRSPQLLPAIPTSLLHIHKLPSPHASPAIYRRPLRDDVETEQNTSLDAGNQRRSRESTDFNIHVESASLSQSDTSNNHSTEPSLLTPRSHAGKPLRQPSPLIQSVIVGSEAIVLPTNELPLGFVPLSPVQPPPVAL